VEDDQELEIFNDIDLCDVEQIDHFDWFSKFVVPEIREVDSFIGTVNHPRPMIYTDQYLFTA
jgi:hypothetical protein